MKMKKIFTKFSLLCIGMMLCAGNAWGLTAPFTRSEGGVTYSANQNPMMLAMMPTMGTVSVAGVTNTNATELTILASVPAGRWRSNDNINLDASSAVAVNSIATGAFTSLTADEVIITLPATVLSLSGTYAATFGNNVKVYATSAELQAAYNSAWSTDKVLFGAASNPSGECGASGDNLTWEFDAENGLLTIEGEGAMANYSVEGFVANTPWKNYVGEITSVTFPEGLTHIGNCAFYGSVITALSLPSTLESIGNNAFTNAQYVSSSNPVDVPASVTTIGNNAFTNTNMTLNFLGTTPPSFGGNFLSSGNTIYVPRGYYETYVEAMGEQASNYKFPASCGAKLEWYIATHDNCYGPCTEPSIHDTLYIIGSGATNDWGASDWGNYRVPWSPYYDVAGDFIQGPANIVIDEDVTYIGAYAFREAAASSVVICNALTAPTLGTAAFRSGMSTLYIPAAANLASYSSWSSYFETIEQIHPSGTCGGVGNEANLTWEFNPSNGTLTITNVAASDPTIALYIEMGWMTADMLALPMADYTAENPAPWADYASQITMVVLPEEISHIGAYAFYNCTALTAITLPEAIKSIGDHAFDGCTSMASMEIEGEIETIGEGAITEETQIEMGEDAAIGLGDANAETIETTLETLLAVTESKETEEDKKINMTIKREIQRNGHFNTICLPFDLNEEQIAASSLNGAEIFEFSDADLNDGELHLDFRKVTSIVAGVPYLFRYMVNESNIFQLDFKGVILSTLEAGISRDFGSVTLRGTLKEPVVLSAQSENNIALLFLGANDTFFWPTSAKTVNPFRAYFTTGTPLQGAPARIRTQENVTTDLETIIESVGVQKLLENGQIIILRNGVRYNTAGQIL